MNKLLYQSKSFVNRHGSTILTCIGGVGVIATAVMAVKDTPKAVQLLEKAKEKKGEDLTKLEIVKAAGPVYIPSFLMGASTLACIFGANVLNQRRQAALMSAYALLDSSYKEYKNKVQELYGEDADTRVRKEIAKDKYEEIDIELDDNKQLFYDAYSERYFESTMEDVIHAEYMVNRKISLWGGARLNEFYEALDIPPAKYGQQLGWSSGMLMSTAWGGWLDFLHEKVTINDDLECCIITMSVEPSFEYDY